MTTDISALKTGSIILIESTQIALEDITDTQVIPISDGDTFHEMIMQGWKCFKLILEGTADGHTVRAIMVKIIKSEQQDRKTRIVFNSSWNVGNKLIVGFEFASGHYLKSFGLSGLASQKPSLPFRVFLILTDPAMGSTWLSTEEIAGMLQEEPKKVTALLRNKFTYSWSDVLERRTIADSEEYRIQAEVIGWPGRDGNSPPDPFPVDIHTINPYPSED